MSAPTNLSLFNRAASVIPGGVNSPVRSFRGVGGTPYFAASASGAYVTDVEGRRYIDYVQSWGASILGHAHPRVVEAIQRAAELGTSFGAPTQREIELAERIRTCVPSCERIRLVSSGTEATMSALRVARGFTNRNRIVKFAGCYHGHADALLAGGGSGVATLGLPDSAGVPEAAVADTLVVQYNEIPTLDESVAAVIVEPVAGNMGVVVPVDGFLEGLRAECDRVGALLIFDEVMTGFRVGLGGAQGHFGIRPDLSCFAKVIGGGLPLAAFGGRAEVMDCLAPVGPVYQAGTLSGNPLATAAGLAVLDQLDERSYLQLAGRAEQLGAWLGSVFDDAGVAAVFPRVGGLSGVFFAETAPRNFDEAKRSDTELYGLFFHELLARGVAFAPSAYEALFPSLSHTKDDLERTADIARAALDAALRRRAANNL